MTSFKTRWVELARLFGVGCTLVVAFWLTTAIAAPAQTFNSLASFDGTNGASPEYMSLVQGRDGNWYGTTATGGSYGYGTVFKITPEGKLTTLYSFCAQPSCADGQSPRAGLVLATDGNFYGTTCCGGANGLGVVFKIAPAGEMSTLYSFCQEWSCADGDFPEASVMQAIDGDFYGTTVYGGANGYGTVFKITSAGTLTTLYSFCSQSNCADGSEPQDGLVQTAGGDFYGTTHGGGTHDVGTVFKLTPSGALTTLHTFAGTDGANPWAGLTQGADGSFYGTTLGGVADSGTVFKITACGKLTTLHRFCTNGCADGAIPYGGLVQASDGDFYGTTYMGGADYSDCLGGCGTIFEITPRGTLTTLHSFDSTGNLPSGALLQATTGTLYGTTSLGGPSNDGTVFSLSMGLGPFVAFVRASGKVGAKVQILGQGFTGTTGVSFNGTPASYTVKRGTYLVATVPSGATTGYVTVATPSGTLQSNIVFRVRQ